VNDMFPAPPAFPLRITLVTGRIPVAARMNRREIPGSVGFARVHCSNF